MSNEIKSDFFISIKHKNFKMLHVEDITEWATKEADGGNSITFKLTLQTDTFITVLNECAGLQELINFDLRNQLARSKSVIIRNALQNDSNYTDINNFSRNVEVLTLNREISKDLSFAVMRHFENIELDTTEPYSIVEMWAENTSTCPNCGSQRITYGELTHLGDGDVAYISTCDKCSCEFNEVYSLTHRCNDIQKLKQ